MELEKKEKPEKKPTLKEEMISYGKTIIVCVVIALLLRTFFIASAVIPTGSMETTIGVGDRILGLKCSYWFAKPERFDIVMFNQPLEGDVLYLKRIIGMPGETVTIRDGEVYINDSKEPLEDSFVNGIWTVANDGMTFEVPEGCYFVMGDNRNNSFDSRYWKDAALVRGFADTEEEAEAYIYVPFDEIYAKAYIKYWNEFAWLG